MSAKIIKLTLGLFCVGCGLAATLTSCSERRTVEEAAQAEAMEVAQVCYDRLLNGDYDGFLAFRNDIDMIPADLRSQLSDAMKTYIATEEKLHGGIKRVKATRAKMDSTLNIMQVYLLMDYGNGTQEEVVVPMVTSPDGQWRMK